MATPSPHLWAFFSPHEPPPPYVPAPADGGAADRILLLARHAMDNGPSFFDMVRSNQAGNPAFAFLTQPPAASSEAGFFRWALWASGCGLPPHQPPPQGFVPPPAVVVVQQQQQPLVQQPQLQQQQYMQQPQLQQQQQYMQHQQPPQLQQAPMMQQQQPQQARPTPPPIPPEVAGGFSQVLDGLSGSKVSERVEPRGTDLWSSKRSSGRGRCGAQARNRNCAAAGPPMPKHPHARAPACPTLPAFFSTHAGVDKGEPELVHGVRRVRTRPGFHDGVQGSRRPSTRPR
jgi:hypothetical protein